MDETTMAPDGYDRVRAHSAKSVNERIDRLAFGTVEECTRKGAIAILRRLEELDHEWDVDRAAMAGFTLLGGASFAAGLSRYATTPFFRPRRKGFLYFFGAQIGFLAMHAVNGWCPPVSLFRRLGYRTAREIEAERSALRAALETVMHGPSLVSQRMFDPDSVVPAGAFGSDETAGAYAGGSGGVAER